MQSKDLWQTILNEIELSISKANFITWFKNTQIYSKKDGIVTVSAPNGFTKEWLENKYNKLILKLLRNISPDVKEVNFVINKPEIKKVDQIQKSQENNYTNNITSQLHLDEFNVNRETNLNPKYNFNNFIIGSFNELAQAAAKAVTKHLGSLYNPLFIYGGVGLGKTHLIQSIGNEINNKYSQKKVKYLTSEKYGQELVDAISKKGMESFKNKYRKVDILIIDDIQFIAGKEKTQEEFFHTFNNLYQKNKQIIISSDRPPKSIHTLEERLRSRFEGGMIADISYPDFETRTAILKSKAKEKKIKLPDEVFSYISENIQNNIRELEGALNRIIAFSQFNNSEINIESVQKMLSQIINQPKKRINFQKIIKTVAEFYDISINDLTNHSRKKELVKPRQITMYLIKKEINSSYPYIGEKIGGRDHTTVMYACKKIDQEIKNDESLSQELNLIKERFYN